MSRTKHHRGNLHMGKDFGAKYKINRLYGGGTGSHPKKEARKERRTSIRAAISEELNEVDLEDPLDVDYFEEMDNWDRISEEETKAAYEALNTYLKGKYG